jgi:hypothetical protein
MNLMETKQIFKNDILILPIFEILFSTEGNTEYLNDFVTDVQNGKNIAVDDRIILLLDAVFHYCGINFSKQSAFNFYITLFILADYKYTHPKERASLFNEHHKEFKNLCFYSDKIIEQSDNQNFANYTFVLYCFELLKTMNLKENIKSAFSYGIFIYVKEIQPLIEHKREKYKNLITESVNDIIPKIDNSKKITAIEILVIPVFNCIFSKQKYVSYLNAFVLEINLGNELDRERAIYVFLKACIRINYNDYIKKLMFYFSLQVLILENHKFKNSIAKERMYYGLYNEYKELFFYSGKANNKLGILYFANIKYIKECFDLFENTELAETTKSLFCYAMYIFEKNIYPIISHKLITEKIIQIEDCIIIKP